MTQDAKDKNLELTDYLEDLLGTSSDAIEKNVTKIDDQSLLIEGEEYQVLVNETNGYRYDAFLERYQDLFAKFDYIVGDWAYDQLRLRGFYQIGTPKVPYDQRIETLEDYLNEYCNFGASYFVIGKKKSVEEYPQLMEELKLGKFATLPGKSRNRRRTFTTKSHHQKKQRHQRSRFNQSSRKERDQVKSKSSSAENNHFKFRQNNRPAKQAKRNDNIKASKGNFTIKQKKS